MKKLISIQYHRGPLNIVGSQKWQDISFSAGLSADTGIVSNDMRRKGFMAIIHGSFLWWYLSFNIYIPTGNYP
jgi:hypothetical protein